MKHSKNDVIGAVLFYGGLAAIGVAIGLAAGWVAVLGLVGALAAYAGWAMVNEVR